MLQSIHVHNFALIEDAFASFTKGFNVFTGETGAGKSILIDAFGLVLGERAAADYVRSGTEELWVQAVFDISNLQNIKDFLQEQGIEVEENLFLKRLVSSAGKSKAFINGIQVPLVILKRLGTKLVDIHGQHENQSLLKKDTPRILTDAFGGIQLNNLLAEYNSSYNAYKEAKTKLKLLEQDNRNLDILLDRYSWEINEITAANLHVGEEKLLADEVRLLQNSERIIKAVSTSYKLLDEDNAILSLLAKVRDQLKYASHYDNRLLPLANFSESSWIGLEDCRSELSSYLSNSDFDETRAMQLQQRLNLIYRLKKKYGNTIGEILNYLQNVKSKYDKLKDITQTLVHLKQEVAAAQSAMNEAASRLTEERKISAENLAKQITLQIHDLAIPYGKLAISVLPAQKFSNYGHDELSFLFSANIGEPLQNLIKIVSGGELSRIALAIKTVMREVTSSTTMVFDEIDSGVGAMTAQKMAEKMVMISFRNQVLCITHLPQIAAYADNHIFIDKQTKNGRTYTILSNLDTNGRLHELMRMMTGISTSKAAYINSSELLQMATTTKEKLQKYSLSG